MIAAVRPSASAIGAWWMQVLDQNASATRQMRELAPLLALHPVAADLTAELLRDLTVWKLIRIANVEFNKLRPQHIPPRARRPPHLLAASEDARWLLVDQRDDGDPRTPRGLRRLG